jgi:predicted CXXCH cytochrome family protein
MKSVKWGLIIAGAVFVALGVGGVAYAFHSGGVAECAGCHSMHSSAPGASFLLVGTDQSSTCLTCHEHAGDTGPSSYHISTATADFINGVPIQKTPGGDFAWVKKDFTYMDNTVTPAVQVTEFGRQHGHNVVAVDKGYAADTSNTTAPGGTFVSAGLACNSCHDAHGQQRRLSSGAIAKTGEPIVKSGSYPGGDPVSGQAVGVYRLLAGLGYSKGTATYSGVPVAKVPSSYNRKENSTQTRVAYGSAAGAGTVEWGAWCQTCHTSMQLHGATASHPVDQGLGSTVANIYKAYVKSGDQSNVDATKGFLSLVPFVEASNNYVALGSHAFNNDTYLAGPTSSDKVSCISCHRAHASGWLHGLRFDLEYEFMVVNSQYIGSDNPVMTSTRGPLQWRGRTMAQTEAAYYDRPASTWASYQRVLCNKCHGWD